MEDADDIKTRSDGGIGRKKQSVLAREIRRQQKGKASAPLRVQRPKFDRPESHHGWPLRRRSASAWKIIGQAPWRSDGGQHLRQTLAVFANGRLRQQPAHPEGRLRHNLLAPLVVLGAARLGSTRLIDNLEF
jgi:hypothetical protein